MAFQLMDERDNASPVVIKVVGVGGGGCNAVQQMTDFDLDCVELICVNTDRQVLMRSSIPNKLQLGEQITRGMGAGCNPEIGRQAAEADRERIHDVLIGANMVFIAAGMGGGTGTGAAPVIANVAREMGILTVAIVTKPFSFEGNHRMSLAEQGLKTLKEEVDCLIIIPNDRISAVMGEEATLLSSFKVVDNVLKDGVYRIAYIIEKYGLINTDFKDIETVMSTRGIAMMGTGEAEGEDRARVATERAVSSPLLNDIDLSTAKKVLVNVSAAEEIKASEYKVVGEMISGMTDQEHVNLKLGLIVDQNLGDKLQVTVIATGIESEDDTYRREDEFMTVESLQDSSTETAETQAATGKAKKSDDLFGIPLALRRRSR